jgi:hypothetical protein
MKRIILKVLLALFVAVLIGVPAFIFWMRAGEEEPLDYKYLDFELGPKDSELNGYTYLRLLGKDYQTNIPENYPYDFERDIDYNRYENWNLDIFESIVEDNKEFLEKIEAAFDRPIFMSDQMFSPETWLYHLSQLRSYVNLSILEARVMHLSGDSEAALTSLANLADEIKTYTQSGGSLIGLLSSAAMNGLLYGEIWIYQANMDFDASEWAAFADTYDVAEYYGDAIQLSMRQEFQSFQNAIENIYEFGVDGYAWSLDDKPSWFYIFSQKALLYVGLRKIRTGNEVFRAYSEIVDQASLPVKERHYDNANNVEVKLRNRGWGSFINRNPYGNVLLSILYPTIRAVLPRVDRAEASASATRISMALQAYYLEQGELPESLDALVPEYLPGIPRDPFGGEPMRYSKEKMIVYSVGNDFVDDGGSGKSFLFELDPYDDSDAAEYDDTEPTFPLRFAMQRPPQIQSLP